MKSLYKRQLLTIFTVIGLAWFLMTTWILGISQNYLVAELQHKTQKNAQFLGAYTASYIQNQPISTLDYQGYVKTLALVSDAFIFVTALEGDDSYATDGENFYPIKRNDVSRAVVEAVVSQGEHEEVTDLGGMFTEERYVYGVTYNQNVAGEAVPMGFIVISPNTEQLDYLQNGFWRVVTVLSFVTVFVVMSLVSFLSAKQTKPLHELSDTAKRFGQGDLTARIEGYEDRKDELGDTIRNFNHMASEIAEVEQHRSTFISNLSHELKTPMTAISGFAEALLDGTVSESKREKALTIIRSETLRLARLVQQMLEISRMEVEEFTLAQEQFDLIELMAQVIIGMEPKLESRRLDVDVDIPCEELLVWGNRDGLTQVCYNLLDNARKFATESTVITVSVVIQDKRVYVSVKNQGETIAPEVLPLLFHRFHKADDSRSAHPEGLGLGLYLVKNIMGKHQEDITVSSEEGVTCFTFTLRLV